MRFKEGMIAARSHLAALLGLILAAAIAFILDYRQDRTFWSSCGRSSSSQMAP